MTVGVVGAGITGLALVHHLDERGVDAVAFEAADRPGGVIRSRTVEGRVLELGPQRTRLTDGVEELVAAAGVRGELLVADDDLPLYVYAGGRLRRAPLSIRAFLATDLLSWRAKARVLAEPLTGPVRPDETAAAAFARKFGREAYENLIGPLFGGTYGSDPAAMPAEHALSGLMRVEEREGSLLRPALRRARGGSGSPPVSFEPGMARLPEALYGAYDDRIELGTPVEAVRETGEGYALVTPAREVEVDRVVVTAPAGEAADLLEGIAPGATGLADLTYNPLAYVYLLAGADREGFGYQVRKDEGLHTLGVTWNASIFDRDDVYTCFVGGMWHPEDAKRPEAELGRIAREEFERVMGCPAEVLHVERVPRALPAYDGSWEALDGLDLPDGVHLATNYTGRVGIPGRVREAERLARRFA